MKGLTFVTQERERKSGVAVNGDPASFVKLSSDNEGDPLSIPTERCVHYWKLPLVPATKPKCVGRCELCGLDAIFGNGPRRYVGLSCGHESESVMSINAYGSWKHFCEVCWVKQPEKEGIVSSKA